MEQKLELTAAGLQYFKDENRQNVLISESLKIISPGYKQIRDPDRVKSILNKKVPLRERKRHTARRVASTHCAVLSPGGGTYPGWGCTYSGWGGTYPGLSGRVGVNLPLSGRMGVAPSQSAGPIGLKVGTPPRRWWIK